MRQLRNSAQPHKGVTNHRDNKKRLSFALRTAALLLCIAFALLFETVQTIPTLKGNGVLGPPPPPSCFLLMHLLSSLCQDAFSKSFLQLFVSDCHHAARKCEFYTMPRKNLGFPKHTQLKWELQSKVQQSSNHSTTPCVNTLNPTHRLFQFRPWLRMTQFLLPHLFLHLFRCLSTDQTSEQVPSALCSSSRPFCIW